METVAVTAMMRPGEVPGRYRHVRHRLYRPAGAVGARAVP